MIRGKIQTENIVKRGTFYGEHSENGTCFLYFEHTVQGMFRNPLFKHRYQADLEAPPTPRDLLTGFDIAGC